MALVASARMYAVAPRAAEAWRALLSHVSQVSDVRLDVIDHAFPARLSELWERPDLGCAFMCGWPFALENRARDPGAPPRKIVAAPVPDEAWSTGRAVYRSSLVVAAGSSFERIEDTFGHRFAFNDLRSHSGVNLPQAFLGRYASRSPLFSGWVGPLTTPRRCLEAVVAGDAEVAAIDSYALRLLQRHDPAFANGVRVVASTPASPIPPLVGSPLLAEDDLVRMRGALTSMDASAAGRALLIDVCLRRFIEVDPAAYDATIAVRSTGVLTDL